MKDTLIGGPIIGFGSIFVPLGNLFEELFVALGHPVPDWLDFYLTNYQWPF